MPFDFEKDFVQPTAAVKEIEESVETADDHVDAVLRDVKCAACGVTAETQPALMYERVADAILCLACAKNARKPPTPEEVSLLPFRPMSMESRVRLLREIREARAAQTFREWQLGIRSIPDLTEPEPKVAPPRPPMDDLEYSRVLAEHLSKAWNRPPPQRQIAPPDDVATEDLARELGWQPECLICSKPTNVVRGLGEGKPVARVCPDCNAVLDRKEPWWLRLARWLAR